MAQREMGPDGTGLDGMDLNETGLIGMDLD